MNCKTPCLDDHHTLGEWVWHRAYINWWTARDKGREFRAAVWGWLADRTVRWA